MSVFSFTCGQNNEQVELVDFSPLHASNNNSTAAAAPDRNRRAVNTAPGRSAQRWQAAESSGEEDDDDDEEGGVRHGDFERRSSSGNPRVSSGRDSAGAGAASSSALDEGEWPPRNNDVGVTGTRSMQLPAGTKESKRG